MLFEELTEVLDAEPHGAALNMAIDEVLLREARTPLLRIYRWAHPAISFGYFDKFSDLGAINNDTEYVRRWTGGGVVVHGADVTYTIIVPATHTLVRLSPNEFYRRIHDGVATVLHASGVETQLAPSRAERTSAACFENPAEADVLAGGRKIAGAAQRRTRWGVLHQGSIQGIALAPAFTAELPRALAKERLRRSLAERELELARALAAEKYATDAWLRRF